MLSRPQRFLLLLPFALVVVPFVIWPMVAGFVLSFTNYAPFRPNLTVQFTGLHNYSRVLSDDIFQQAILHVLVFIVVTVVLEMFIGLMTAWALRKEFRGRLIVRVVVLIPWLISPIASGVIWHYIFNARTGLFNLLPAYLGLPLLPSPLGTNLAFGVMVGAEVWRQSALVTFLILPGMLAIPHDQWANARLDGLSVYWQIRLIVLPYLRVLLLTIMLLLIGSTLGTSESILLLTRGGPGTQTMLPGLYSYNKAIQAWNWTLGATSGWIIAAGVLGVGIIYLYLTGMREPVQ